jgi:hypothetical protein
VEQVVALYTSATALAVNLNPSNYHEPVVLTATVTTSGPNVPTGEVTFYSGGTNLGTSTLDSTGTATLSTTRLQVGSDLLTGIYKGDSQNGKSTSQVLIQTVD